MQDNQDEVAMRLWRPDISEMHQLMVEYEKVAPTATWTDFILSDATEAFLLSHGWGLEEYATECRAAPNTTMKRQFGSLIYD